MKWFKRLAVLIGVVAALIVTVILGLGWFVAPQDKLEKADAIVVVSGGDTVRRTEEGVRLWKDDWAPLLVFSGAAADRGTSNAAVMRNRAIAQGVPASAILVEEKSTTTKENAEFLKPVIEAQNIHTAILVSSPYHTRRVKETFRRVYGKDLKLIARPAADASWSRRTWWQSPTNINLTLSEAGKTFYTVFLQP
ncbi:YdcF family protein [Patescibacteria group bacterium]|nr:YdcF family protein [Patescibacteria group bacterium]